MSERDVKRLLRLIEKALGTSWLDIAQSVYGTTDSNAIVTTSQKIWLGNVSRSNGGKPPYAPVQSLSKGFVSVAVTVNSFFISTINKKANAAIINSVRRKVK